MCVGRGRDFSMAPSTLKNKVTSALIDVDLLLELVTLHGAQPGSGSSRQFQLSRQNVIWTMFQQKYWNPVRLTMLLLQRH